MKNLSLLTAANSPSGRRYEALCNQCDPMTGGDDVVILRDGEKVWGTNSLGNDLAYTTAKRKAWNMASSEGVA